MYRILFRFYDWFIYRGKIHHYLAEHEKRWNDRSFNSNIIFDKGQNFSALTKADIRKKLSNRKSSRHFRLGKTGGSTGEALNVPMSRNRAALNTASFLFWNQKAGYKLGSPYMVFRAKPRSRIIQFLRNETVITPQSLVTEELQEILNVIDTKSIQFLIGYPSILLALTRLSNHSYKFSNLDGIVTVSEGSTLDERRKISSYFGCQVYDRYSCEEVGLVAQEYQGKYLWNTFSLKIRLIQEFNDLFKIYLTDEYQDIFEMHDYDIGDLVQVRDGIMVRVEGRCSDIIYNVQGEIVPALFLGPPIYSLVATKDYLSKFRFVQKSALDYRILLEGTRSLEKDEISKLVKELKLRLGDEARISLELVSTLPSLGDAGKHRIYLNIAPQADQKVVNKV